MTDPLNLAPLTADALIADPRLTAVLADAEQPLALLPVRLETRYAEGELLVRIYPDQVHVDAHDPRLSEAEQAAGQEFWRGQWRTGTNTARQQRLWAALAERFGPGRAGWVARATRPTNPAARPNANGRHALRSGYNEEQRLSVVRFIVTPSPVRSERSDDAFAPVTGFNREIRAGRRGAFCAVRRSVGRSESGEARSRLL